MSPPDSGKEPECSINCAQVWSLINSRNSRPQSYTLDVNISGPRTALDISGPRSTLSSCGTVSPRAGADPLPPRVPGSPLRRAGERRFCLSCARDVAGGVFAPPPCISTLLLPTPQPPENHSTVDKWKRSQNKEHCAQKPGRMCFGRP